MAVSQLQIRTNIHYLYKSWRDAELQITGQRRNEWTRVYFWRSMSWHAGRIVPSGFLGPGTPDLGLMFQTQARFSKEERKTTAFLHFNDTSVPTSRGCCEGSWLVLRHWQRSKLSRSHVIPWPGSSSWFSSARSSKDATDFVSLLFHFLTALQHISVQQLLIKHQAATLHPQSPKRCSGEPMEVSHSWCPACSTGMPAAQHPSLLQAFCSCSPGPACARISRVVAQQEVTVQEAPRHVKHFLVPRPHGLQRYSSDQLTQCCTPSRHSALGTQEQYS